MNSPREITFFGANYRIAQFIHELYPVVRIVCERRAFNIDLHNFALLNDIEFMLVEKRADLRELPSAEGSLGISCGFGIIFKKKVIDKFELGIWNIHYGKLPDIRGRHPISWAFLRSDKEFFVSIHEIDEEIDQGYLLAQGSVRRSLTDTQEEIEHKIEQLLSDSLLKTAFENAMSGNRTPLGEGTYYENLAHKFDEVQPDRFDSVFMFNLFKSQAVYGGVRINGERYRECAFYHEDFPSLFSDYRVFTCNDGRKIAVRK